MTRGGADVACKAKGLSGVERVKKRTKHSYKMARQVRLCRLRSGMKDARDGETETDAKVAR